MMYSVMPAKMKNISVTTLHPKLIAGLHPKFWRMFVIHELERSKEKVNEDNIKSLSDRVQKGVIDTDELNRVYLNGYLDSIGIAIPIVLPGFMRDEQGNRRWHAYYQTAATTDVSNPNGLKDARIGLGDFDSRNAAETVAFYKCFEIIEEKIQ